MLFKNRFMLEANHQHIKAKISFEVITRDIEDFPKRVVIGQDFLVENWGKSSEEEWFYSTRGTAESYVAGTPVGYAEMLEPMMPKFLQELLTLGFDSCSREPGTWRFAVTWTH